jgi:hypothetical protein
MVAKVPQVKATVPQLLLAVDPNKMANPKENSTDRASNQRTPKDPPNDIARCLQPKPQVQLKQRVTSKNISGIVQKA